MIHILIRNQKGIFCQLTVLPFFLAFDFLKSFYHKYVGFYHKYVGFYHKYVGFYHKYVGFK